VLALLRPVNPSRQLRWPQRHAPTTTPLHPLPLPKRRARFMPVRASHPLSNSTGPYLVYGSPSTSAILFYQSSSRHRRQLLLPILTAAAYTAPNDPLPPRHLAFHFTTTSGFPLALMQFTYEYCHHLIGGRSGLHFHLSFLVFLTLPLLEVQERVVPRTSITVPFPYATWPSSGLTPSSGTPYTCHIILHYKGPVLIFILTLYSLLFFATLIPSLPSLYHTHRTHNLCSTSAKSYPSAR
jgi:hypothetical protein